MFCVCSISEFLEIVFFDFFAIEQCFSLGLEESNQIFFIISFFFSKIGELDEFVSFPCEDYDVSGSGDFCGKLDGISPFWYGEDFFFFGDENGLDISGHIV
jgi:hypothetical protein